MGSARNVLMICLAATVSAALAGEGHATSDLDGDVIHQRSILQDLGGGEMEGKDYDYLIPYHGWMMATAFGLLFPLGAALPIIFKGTRLWPTAFIVHLVVQILAGLFIIAGLALGQKLALEGSPKHIHRGIGIAVFAFVWLQIIMSVSVRPLLHSRSRGLFNVLHWWIGRTILVVGAGNAYYGMNISLPATRYFVGFSVAIGGILLLAVIGQLVVHATFPYDYEGHVVLSPAADKTTPNGTYQNTTARSRLDQPQA